MTQLARETFVTARQIARVLGISTGTVYRLARRGELPSIRVGGSVRFNPDQVAGVVVATNLGKGRRANV